MVINGNNKITWKQPSGCRASEAVWGTAPYRECRREAQTLLRPVQIAPAHDILLRKTRDTPMPTWCICRISHSVFDTPMLIDWLTIHKIIKRSKQVLANFVHLSTFLRPYLVMACTIATRCYVTSQPSLINWLSFLRSSVVPYFGFLISQFSPTLAFFINFIPVSIICIRV